MLDLRTSPFAGQDIRTLLAAQALAKRNKTFLIWAPFEGDEQRWTYGAFVARAKRVAAGLHRRGVRPGDRVLIHLENCPEGLLAWFGCGILGAIAVTTNARSSADELAYFASHSRAVGAITQPKFRALLSDAVLNSVQNFPDSGGKQRPIVSTLVRAIIRRFRWRIWGVVHGYDCRNPAPSFG